MDIAKRCEQNPLLAPKDLKAGINGMEFSNIKAKFGYFCASQRDLYRKKELSVFLYIMKKEK